MNVGEELGAPSYLPILKSGYRRGKPCFFFMEKVVRSFATDLEAEEIKGYGQSSVTVRLRNEF